MPGSETNARLVAAIDYAKRGWSVIPVEPHGKQPLVAWRRFQSEIASIATVSAWFDRWPQANVAIVTGRLSGLVVLDVDARHDGPASPARLAGPSWPSRVVDGGNTVVIIEHNSDIIKNCQYVVDLGPEGGDGGGEILYQGALSGIMKVDKSYTRKYL